MYDPIGAAAEEAAKVAAAGAVAGVLGWAAIKRQKIRAWLAAYKSRRAAMAVIAEKVEKIIPAIEMIEKQVSANGGGSLFDAVTRAERAIAELRVDMAAVKASTASTEVIVRSHSDLATEGEFEADADGNFNFVNLTMARMLGVGRADLGDLRWKDYLHPEDAAMFERRLETSLSQSRMLSARVRMVRSDNELITLDITMLPHPDVAPANRWFGKARLVV